MKQFRAPKPAPAGPDLTQPSGDTENNFPRGALCARFFAIVIFFAGTAAAQEYRLGPAFNGAWHNPDHPGQGLMVTARENGTFFFAGWFTYQTGDEEQPGAHRWWTIEGEYEDASSELDIYLTTGGEFVSGFPVISNAVGIAYVTLEGCDTLVLDYEFDGGGQGSVTLERLLPVSDDYCNSLLVIRELETTIEADTPVVFRNVQLVSMVEGAPLVSSEETSVLVANGGIQAVGPYSSLYIPPQAVVIDGQGRYLMPGLTDTHTHLAVNVREFLGYATPGTLELVSTNQLQLYLAHGVTTIINLGDFGEPQTLWAQEIDSGTRIGPTLYAAKYARGAVGTCDGGPPEVVVGPTFEDGQDYVRAAIEEGYPYLKVYNCTPPGAVEGIVAEAEASGVSVAGHFPGLVDSESLLLQDGFSLVAHAGAYLWNGYLQRASSSAEKDEVVSTMLAGKVAVSTTLWIGEKIAQVWCRNQAGIDAWMDEVPMELMHSTEVKLHQRSISSNRFAPDGCVAGGYDGDLHFARDMVRRIQSAGGEVLAGTDSPTVLGVAGHSMHDGLRALRRAGLTLKETIAAATRNPGRYVGRTIAGEAPFGQVIEGYRADLILLDRPPEEALEDFYGSLELVVARGAVYPRSVRDAWLVRIRSDYGN